MHPPLYDKHKTTRIDCLPEEHVCSHFFDRKIMWVMTDPFANMYCANSLVSDEDFIYDGDDEFSLVHGLCDQAVAREELEQVMKNVKTRKAVVFDGTYPEFLFGSIFEELECLTAPFDRVFGSKYLTE